LLAQGSKTAAALLGGFLFCAADFRCFLPRFARFFVCPISSA
jgi:hypothetical protein